MYQSTIRVLVMDTTTTISKWVLQTLHENGFDASRLKVQVNKLLPVAVAGEGRKSVDFWTGIYHVIPFEGSVCLYVYKQMNQEGKFFKSSIASSDMDPIDQPKEFDQEEMDISKQSRKDSLNDPKFQKELNSVRKFISDHNGSVDADTFDVNTSISDNDFNNTDVDKNPLSSEVSLKPLESSATCEISNRTENNQELVVADLSDLFNALSGEIIQGHWVHEYYKGFEQAANLTMKIIDRPVRFSDPSKIVNQELLGNLIIKYGDSQNSKDPIFSIASLTDNGYCIETPYFLAEENNFALIGGSLSSDDKWYFVTDDFNSATSIQRATGIKTIAVAKGVDLGFVFNELLTCSPNAKVRYFRNESIEFRPARLESLKFDAQYNIGHIFLDRDIHTWGGYSYLYEKEHGEFCDAEFKKLINGALQEYKTFIANF